MKAQKVQAPTKGVKPRTEGVPGVLVDTIPEGVVFGGKFRSSPYDPLLQQLKQAGPGKFLRFDDLRCRPSIYARSKKLGIRVQFGEQGETLWVALAKADLTSDGVSEETKKTTNAELVIEAIKARRCTAGEIVSWMRSNGAPGIGITQVDGLLRNLTREGRLKLRTAPAGSEAPERWQLKEAA